MNNSADKKQSESLKEGQIWELGNHRLLIGDCTDASLVNELLKGVTVNAIVVDPPYGVMYVKSKEGIGNVAKEKDIANDDITNEGDYEKFSRAWIELVLPYLAKKNSIYIFNCDKMLFALKKAMDACGIYFSQLIIWVKSHATLARKDYAPQHELVLYGWHGTHVFRKAKDKSVICYPKPSKSELHPTTKPVPVVSRLILNSTKIGDVVYDPFLGSGTTLIACEQTKRICYGAEIDLEYAEIIITRFEHLSKLKSKCIYEKIS